jgi:potassium-transporting ATPase ATP-binding subunit
MNTQNNSRIELYRRAFFDSLLKLNPRTMLRNPVMFIVEIGSILTTILYFRALIKVGDTPASFIGLITIWLWITVIFANFAEAIAEGRGKAQAAALRKTRKDSIAKKMDSESKDHNFSIVSSVELREGDLFLVETGDIIPVDGEIIDGIASVDESAVTGESAPVIRESGGDRSAVTGGTRVLSDWLVVKVSSNPGEGFLDRMITLVEGAKRQKTPNELALSILLSAFTIIFLTVTVTLLPFSNYSVEISGKGYPISLTVLIALLICLIPTTIGGLLSAIGIAGMDRLVQRNVLAMSGRAVEAAGDVDVLLLDKTGTITFGNRQAAEFIPVVGISEFELADAAQLASLADETPEGRSIVVLAKNKFGMRGRKLTASELFPDGMHFIPFTAQTRMSGVDLDHTQIRKGAADSILSYVHTLGKSIPLDVESIITSISQQGGTPLVVARNGIILGAIHLKDIVKGGIRERFAQLRKMGIKTIMITGDNPLTAAAIATEAGVDDFLALATPEKKLDLIRSFQTGGQLVAMTGDGTNDAPALAQADVAVAMNSGTQPAREAANMIDLDSNPTKLIEIVEIGKQLLMTRGSLTTFSIANDISKYFVIIPAAFSSTYPALDVLNILRLHSPQSAILSAVIFNALIIIALIPLALRGVPYKPKSASQLLQTNLMVYGFGGLFIPFLGIKLIDSLISIFA